MNLKPLLQNLFGQDLFYENVTQNQLVEVQRRIILKQTVHFALWVLSILTLLWGIIDYFAFPIDLWLSLMKVRIITVVMMMVMIWYIKMRGYVGGFVYLLFIFPQYFSGYSFYILADHDFVGLAQATAITYSNIPFVLMAGIGLLPLRFIRALIAFLLVFVGTMLTHKWGGEDLSSTGFLAEAWLLIVIGIMAIIISRIQYRLLSSLVNKNIIDPLTGALSRAAGQLILDLNIATAKRGQGSVAIAFLDLDHFKSVNDDFGHEAGDDVLMNFAKIILDRKRDTDAFIRWGGEEFILVLAELDKIDPQKAIERVLRGNIGTRPDGTRLTISGGVVDWVISGAKDCSEFVQMADQKMYRAKEEGRNRIIGYWDEQ